MTLIKRVDWSIYYAHTGRYGFIIMPRLACCGVRKMITSEFCIYMYAMKLFYKRLDLKISVLTRMNFFISALYFIYFFVLWWHKRRYRLFTLEI